MGGVISLSPVVEGLKRVEKGVDKTASELAIARLQEERSQLAGRIDELRGSRTYNQSLQVGCGGVLAIGSLLALSVGAGLPGIVFLLIGVGLVVLAAATSSTSDEEKQLNEAIAEKDAEIARHQQIVKS